MRIAIVGGNGTVGAEAARELERRGHEVRVLSRRAPRYPVDLRDGSGLAAALDGVEVVVDAANGDRKVLVDGTARLLRAAREAGVRHHVGVSIVGVDRVGGRYYKAKLAQEAGDPRESGVPWTIVRATQFHTLVARTFAASAKLGIVPSAAIPMQPVDPREVGRVLAETAEAEPSLAITQFAGPEVAQRARAGAALAARRRARTPSRCALPVHARAARRRADEPGRVARQGDLRRSGWRRHDATLAERFEALRPGLLRLAYGQLGSLAESEDVVQEAWLRLQRVDADEIRDLKGWLTTAVSRLALDTLRSARVRREAYVGPWLPEPVVEEPGPAERAGIAEDLSLALLVVLESLSASERVAFVLHDIFGYEFKEVAAVLDATPQAARQQASRARRAVEARRPRFPATREQQRDGPRGLRPGGAGGRPRAPGRAAAPRRRLHQPTAAGTSTAARKPIVGAERVARAMRALTKAGAAEVAIVDVNGMPGVLAVGGAASRPWSASPSTTAGSWPSTRMRNPDKLRLP